MFRRRWASRARGRSGARASWPVGLGANETQQSEYFGPDCSMLRCPTGDDPMTAADETDCFNKTAVGGRGRGRPGNKCHVDCSNRGTCDHITGLCLCNHGFYDENCAKQSELAISAGGV